MVSTTVVASISFSSSFIHSKPIWLANGYSYGKRICDAYLYSTTISLVIKCMRVNIQCVVKTIFHEDTFIYYTISKHGLWESMVKPHTQRIQINSTNTLQRKNMLMVMDENAMNQSNTNRLLNICDAWCVECFELSVGSKVTCKSMNNL